MPDRARDESEATLSPAPADPQPAPPPPRPVRSLRALARGPGNLAVQEWAEARPRLAVSTPILQRRAEDPTDASPDAARDEARRFMPAEPAPATPQSTQTPPGAVPALPPTYLVADTVVELVPGQARQGEFLFQLKEAVCREAENALAGTLWSAAGCPYIQLWFDYYAAQDANHVERALHRFAPETLQAASAQAYIPLVVRRVRQGVQTWVATGRVEGVPPDLPATPLDATRRLAERMLPGGPSLPGGRAGELLRSAGGLLGRAVSGLGVFLKRQEASSLAGPAAAHDPQVVRAQLRGGEPLPSSQRLPMETAFRRSFTGVRLHTDAQAGQLARSLHARAFTVGQEIAFAPGQYRPGTPLGDVLLAHELAHVAQQSGNQAVGAELRPAANPAATRSVYAYLETAADQAALAALAGGRAAAAQPAVPHGLELQRCGGSDQPEYATTFTVPAGAQIAPGMSEAQPGVEEDIYYNLDAHAYTARIDGDGDEQRELQLCLRSIREDRFHQLAEVEIGLEQISSHTARSARFPVPTEVGRGGGDFHPRILVATDGYDPTRLQITEWGGIGAVAEIFPPERTSTGLRYRIDLAGASQTLDFPPEATPQFLVFQAQLPGQVGPIWTSEVGIGAYRDRFRLSFTKPDPDGDQVIVGMSAMGEEGPVGGERVDARAHGTLSVSLLESSPVSLAFDLNGDGQADLTLYDRLRAEPDYSSSFLRPIPERFRTHFITFITSGRLQQLVTWNVRNGRLEAGTSFPSERDFPAASQAQAADLLASQVQSGDYIALFGETERRLMDSRRQAAEQNLIRPAVYQTWRAFSDAILQLQLEAGRPGAAPGAPSAVSQAARERVKTTARIFHNELATETLGAKERVSLAVDYEETVNPYTGDHYVEEATYEGNGQDRTDTRVLDQLIADVDAARYNGLLTIYRSWTTGLDRWILSRMRMYGRGRREEAETLEAMISLNAGLQEISENRPKRVWAIIHAHTQYEAEGRVRGVPLFLFYYRRGNTWHLVDLTNPREPFHPTMEAQPGEQEPPPALFQRLNDEDHFPEDSLIYYVLPSGTSGRVLVDEGVTWEDFFTWLGIGLAAAGIILSTAGAGTSVAVAGAYALAGAGISTAIASGLDLAHHASQGSLTGGRILLDLANIVGGLAGATSIISGRLVMGARLAQAGGTPWEGWRAVVAGIADPVLLPASVAAAGGDLISFGIVASDTLRQLEAIENGPGTDADKARAKLLLLANLAVGVGMAALTVRGTIEGFTPGRRIYLENVRGVLVARAEGLSFAGQRIQATRPLQLQEGALEVSPQATGAGFRQATTEHLANVQRLLPGEAGQRLAQVEEQALQGAWHQEQSLRLLDPIFSSPALRQVRDPRIAEAVRNHQRRLVEIFNDTGLSLAGRRTALRRELDALDATLAGVPEVRQGLPLAQARAGLDALEDTSAGLLAMDPSGNLTRGGRTAGRLPELVDQVIGANNLNAAHGIPVEYVVTIEAPTRPGGPATVQVLPRTRTPSLAPPPTTLPAELPALPAGTQGRYIVDVGVGTSGYAIDMVPRAERQASQIVQTDVPAYTQLAQSRRRLGFAEPGPRHEETAIVVFGDALQNMESFFGRPLEGRGVRRMFLNNVNAHYTPAQYQRMAEGMGQTMARGGRVEVQWDTSPEPVRGTGHTQPRGHIDGPTLKHALEQHSGRHIRYTEEPGIPYRYTIEASRARGGTRVPESERPRPPDPTAPTGHRAVIEFLD